MKNTLRYLLIAILMSMTSVLSVASATAQNLAQQPQAQMQSTSVMPASGSTLPQAAQTGTVTTYDVPSGPRNGHVRKIGGGNSGGGDGPTNPDDPWATPLGDATWPLMLLAIAYVGVRTFHKKTRVN